MFCHHRHFWSLNIISVCLINQHTLRNIDGQWQQTLCSGQQPSVGHNSGQVGCGKAAEILALEINFSVLSCCSQQSEGGLSKGPKYFSLEGGLACCLLCCGAQTLSLELLKPPKSPTASPARDLQRSIFCSFKHSQDRLQQRMQEGIPKARFIFLPVWDKFSRQHGKSRIPGHSPPLKYLTMPLAQQEKLWKVLFHSTQKQTTNTNGL